MSGSIFSSFLQPVCVCVSHELLGAVSGAVKTPCLERYPTRPRLFVRFSYYEQKKGRRFIEREGSDVVALVAYRRISLCLPPPHPLQTLQESVESVLNTLLLRLKHYRRAPNAGKFCAHFTVFVGGRGKSWLSVWHFRILQLLLYKERSQYSCFQCCLRPFPS